MKTLFNFRLAWYASLVWILAFFISGIIVVPWLYVVLPLAILLLTVYYLDDSNLRRIKRADRDILIKYGIGGAIFWFVAAGLFSFLEFAGFYYFDLSFYLSDVRNVILFPIVLLVPLLYSIVLSNSKLKKRGRKKNFQSRLVKAFRF